LPPAPPIGGVGLVPRRPCIEFPCPMLAVPGKARCRIHEAQLQRAKWARNPNRDMGYRRLKRLVVLPVPCAICGEAITRFGHDGGSHTFDHVTPWSEAPSNDPSNLRHAHRSCNSRRGRGPRVA
jgi:5-methylcytosine-specific restriction endonuclease McrA